MRVVTLYCVYILIVEITSKNWEDEIYKNAFRNLRDFEYSEENYYDELEYNHDKRVKMKQNIEDATVTTKPRNFAHDIHKPINLDAHAKHVPGYLIRGTKWAKISDLEDYDEYDTHEIFSIKNDKRNKLLSFSRQERKQIRCKCCEDEMKDYEDKKHNDKNNESIDTVESRPSEHSKTEQKRLLCRTDGSECINEFYDPQKAFDKRSHVPSENNSFHPMKQMKTHKPGSSESSEFGDFNPKDAEYAAPRVSDLFEEITDLFNKLRLQIQENNEESFKMIEKNITQKIYSKLKKRSYKMSSKIKVMHEIMKKQVKVLKHLDNKLGQRNVILFGIAEKEQNYSELEKLVWHVINHNMQVDCDLRELEYVARIGKKKSNPRPIRVTLTTYGKKIAISNQNKILKRAEYYRHLSFKNNEIVYH